MRDSNSASCALCVLLLTLLSGLLPVATGKAQSAQKPSAEPSSEEAPTSRLSLGISTFAGGVFSEEKRTAGGGAGLVAAFAVVPERWEIELGLTLVKPRAEDPLGVVEVVGKRLFERRGAWAPHLLLGPVFSLDFGHDVKSSGGVLLGTGVSYWFHDRFGAVVDGAYRLLLSRGPEAEHVLTLALGLRVRV